MTQARPRSFWAGIAGILLGLVLAAISIPGLADSAGNLSPRALGGIGAGVVLVIVGFVLAIKSPEDARPVPRYLYETALSILDTFGDWVASPRAALILMIPVLILAAALRFHKLTFQSFWLDELMTWWRSSYADLPTVLRSVESDVWPPGFSLWAWALIHTLGASDFILRFFPALAGVLSAAAIYTLGRRLGGHLAGLFAALLIAVLEITIYYSQEARPYSGLILFSILSTYFLLRVIDRLAGIRPRHVSSPLWVDIAAYIATALLAMYWNYYGLVLVAFQGIGAALCLIRRPRAWVPLVKVYGAIAIGYLPWLVQTFADLGRDVYLAVRPGGYFDELMAFFRVLFNLEQNYVLAAIALVIAAIVAEAIRKSRVGRSPHWAVWLILLGWLLLPFTLTWVRSLSSVSTFLHRYLLISLPAAVLLPALALSRLPVKRWMQAGVMLLAAAILLNNLVRHWDYYSRPTKAQFREVVEIASNLDARIGDPGVIVGFTGYHGTGEIFSFYLDQFGSTRRMIIEAGFGPDTSAVDMAVAQSDARYVMVIAAQNPPDPAFIEAMDQKYTRVMTKEYVQATVWLYEVKEPAQ